MKDCFADQHKKTVINSPMSITSNNYKALPILTLPAVGSSPHDSHGEPHSMISTTANNKKEVLMFRGVDDPMKWHVQVFDVESGEEWTKRQFKKLSGGDL
ncbi:hypothetical protein NPIL_481191 [Nephila pilipes]|uniref:Uncharacterized protein n=1 Tax=Nephila pilipes TaxID=299642 RepID=A0A8X6MP99_NEPPI|nr:hypothetical protein NPIL_481191 [Nephila pilipes]